MHIPRFEVVAVLLGLFAGVAAASVQIPDACVQKCENRNLPASCAWLTPHPRRCLHKSLHACARDVRRGLPVACPLSPSLPGCLTDHGCPFGSRCLDGACQVLPCTAPCGAHDECQGNMCLVADCGASSENCPAGFHCEPADDPLKQISGACKQNDFGIRYCTSDIDCIGPGIVNVTCARGHCVLNPQRRRRRHPFTTTTTSSTTSTLPGGPTTTVPGTACSDAFDCSGGDMCCDHLCVRDPFAHMGICSTLHTAACTLCTSDLQCACNGIFCDVCEGTASLSGCVNPCSPQAE